MYNKALILKKIVDLVDRTSPNSEVYLYGSRARGTAKKLSDWDVLILLNTQQLTFDFETCFMDNFYEIELETGQIISPLIYTKRDWNENYKATQLFSNIKNEGVRIL